MGSAETAVEVYDSKWDLRRPWMREELLKAVAKAVGKKEKTTREVADAVRCNHAQAKAALDKLWDQKVVVAFGEKRFRTWRKAG